MSKIAFITGASSGIGAACARKFAQGGYTLLLNARSIDKLQALKTELETAYGIDVELLPFDVRDRHAAAEALNSLPEEYRAIDVLVNNAGISYIGLLTDMTYDDWKRVIDTNLGGCFLTSRYAVPGMVSRKKGKIINISSVWGNVGASMEVAYSASKGGINAFTKALAKELGPSNIQVNAIACGIIDTDMNQCFAQEELEALVQEIPMDRLGKPQEVAKLVLQLCEGNEYLTGQIITLDGGWI